MREAVSLGAGAARVLADGTRFANDIVDERRAPVVAVHVVVVDAPAVADQPGHLPGQEHHRHAE